MNGPKNDIASRAAFYEFLHMGLRLKEGAIIVGGPPCSMQIFLSSAVHKRHAGAEEGDLTHRNVRMSNLIVDNYIYMPPTIQPWRLARDGTAGFEPHVQDEEHTLLHQEELCQTVYNLHGLLQPPPAEVLASVRHVADLALAGSQQTA